MNFVIVGSALYGNKGAAAMLESSVQTLTKRYPDARFTLLSLYPANDQRLNTFDNLKITNGKVLYLGLIINPAALSYFLLPPLRPLLKRIPAIKALAEADALLDQGGITFNDGREVFLIYNIASILPALLMRRPVIKCAQALGPFKNPINRLAAKIFLPKMRLIIARGEYSFSNLKSLKLKNVVLGADYAFSLSISPKHIKEARPYLAHRVFKTKRQLVGIAPSIVIKNKFDKENKDYVGMMAGFVGGLIEQGYSVALLPHSMRPKSAKSHNNDLSLCADIYAKVNDNQNCYFLKDEVGSQALRYIIGQCDLFVASRFHSMVAALSMNVPTMVIGWSHKYTEVLKMFGLEEQALDYKGMTPKKLTEAFNKLEIKRTSIKKQIDKHLPSVKKLSREHVAYIEGVVRS